LSGYFTFEKDRQDNKSTKNKWKLRGSYDYYPAKQWESIFGLEIPKRSFGLTGLAAGFRQVRA
jgi:hypothetical protein